MFSGVSLGQTHPAHIKSNMVSKQQNASELRKYLYQDAADTKTGISRKTRETSEDLYTRIQYLHLCRRYQIIPPELMGLLHGCQVSGFQLRNLVNILRNILAESKKQVALHHERVKFAGFQKSLECTGGDQKCSN